MKRIALVALLIAPMFASCTNEEAAARTLRVNGYKDVRLTGYEFWGCSKDDGTCTGFEATAPNGERVKGAVGCGLFGCDKGCTVRLGQ